MRFIYSAMLLCLCAIAAKAQDLPRAVTDADYRAVSRAEAKLGQLLFYDPILSGNKTVACATCHHPKFATSDGVSLSIGDGGIGLGPARRADPENIPEKRIPRNAPALFNLGAHEFNVMFHDGRLEAQKGAPGGIRTPIGQDMLEGFASVLSAQTMFPVLSRDEMAGSYRENEVAKLVRQGRISGAGGAWDVLSKRVSAISEYADSFQTIYPHITQPNDIAFTDISNAIAAFMELEWRSDTAPFDAVLRGQTTLSGAAQRGMELFYGNSGCGVCHSGPFLTDHAFHAMGTPQIGPGKSADFEEHHRDDGRFRVTGDPADQFAFRTPSLRNVARTGPYGHSGSHRVLRDYIAFHANPRANLPNYRIEQALLPEYATNDDATFMSDQQSVQRLSRSVKAEAIKLSDENVADLLAFLDTLTDPASIKGRLGIPATVPSGLTVP